MVHQSLRLLSRWFSYAENFWYPMPDRPAMGCFGAGYNGAGVVANQQYVSAASTLAMLGEDIEGLDHQHALQRALAALRFSFASHVSGDYRCTDNTRWGHTRDGAFGLERMMHGIYMMEPLLEDEDSEALRRVITSEADWSTSAAASAEFQPDIWNGAILWRAAAMYPDHANAPRWQELAGQFLQSRATANGGHYFDVKSQIAAMCSAAVLHFDLRLKKFARPDALSFADLWPALRRMIFSDGRVGSIGVDRSVRYGTEQDDLLPALLYAADHLGDAHAMGLVDAGFRLIEEEMRLGEEGAFYSHRLAPLLDRDPFLYAKLEASRAGGLALLATYWSLVKRPAEATGDFESSAGGAWDSPEMSAAVHRTRSRFASFAWRSQGLATAICVPSGDGQLAEWDGNLGGSIRFLGEGEFDPIQRRELIRHTLDLFEGGFAACGAIAEGARVRLGDNWKPPQPLATTQLAFIALPDEHTTVVFQYCRLNQSRAFVSEIKGLRLNVPNDLHNGFQRTLTTVHGPMVLNSPPEGDEIIDLASGWVNVDGRLGVVGLFGAGEMSIHRAGQRRGPQQSMFVDELCFKCEIGVQGFNANQVLLDIGCAVVSGINAQQTLQLADIDRTAVMPLDHPDLRAVRVAGFDGKRYGVVANFGAAERQISVARATELITGQRFGQTLSKFPIQSGQARVFLLD